MSHVKIALCIFNYFPYGGLQRDFFRILQACLQRGHCVDVFTSSWQGEYPDGINIFIIPVSGFTHAARVTCFIQKMLKRVATYSYDRVVGFNKIPHVDWCFVGDLCLKEKLSHRFLYYGYLLLPRYRRYWAHEKALFGKNSQTKIMLLTSKQQEAYQKYYPASSGRIVRLPPGIPRYQWTSKEIHEKRSEIRRTLGLDHDAHELVLLFVASSFYNKGLDRAIRALASALPSYSLILCVIGQDKRKKEFLRLAERCRVQAAIRMIGATPRVFDYMLASDILIHPARTEAAGMVLLEAMTTGLPIITTANCGYAEQVSKAQAGMVLPVPFSQKKLNQALEMLCSQADYREKLRLQARDYSMKADWYSLAEKAVRLIEQ